MRNSVLPSPSSAQWFPPDIFRDIQRVNRGRKETRAVAVVKEDEDRYYRQWTPQLQCCWVYSDVICLRIPLLTTLHTYLLYSKKKNKTTNSNMGIIKPGTGNGREKSGWSRPSPFHSTPVPFLLLLLLLEEEEENIPSLFPLSRKWLCKQFQTGEEGSRGGPITKCAIREPRISRIRPTSFPSKESDPSLGSQLDEVSVDRSIPGRKRGEPKVCLCSRVSQYSLHQKSFGEEDENEEWRFISFVVSVGIHSLIHRFNRWSTEGARIVRAKSDCWPAVGCQFLPACWATGSMDDKLKF